MARLTLGGRLTFDLPTFREDRLVQLERSA
jgi:hypothetical protein